MVISPRRHGVLTVKSRAPHGAIRVEFRIHASRQRNVRGSSQREVTTQRHNAKNRSIWSRFGYDAESHREVTTRRTALSKVTLKSRTRRWGRPPGLRPASTPASPMHLTGSRTWRSGAGLETRPTCAAATFISMGGPQGHGDSLTVAAQKQRRGCNATPLPHGGRSETPAQKRRSGNDFSATGHWSWIAVLIA